MATVIFSNAGDTDTAVLKFIWRGLPNVKLVEVNKQTVNAKEIVEQAIEAEHDTLICCGHGSQMGLYNPAGTGYSFLVNRQNYKKIKVNRFIGVWCHASEFGEAVHLKGFYSSMFISNKNEAEMNHCYQASAKCITEQEILFALRLNELIKTYTPMKKWVGMLNEAADKTIDIVKFNYDGLKYLTKFEGEVPEYTEYGYRAYTYSGYSSGGFYGSGSTYGGSSYGSSTGTGKYRSGHWDYQLNRYVYDDEKTETKKTTTTTQPSLSSPSVDYYRSVYGAGATKKEEPKKEAAKSAPQLETDWDDDWENYRC
jgi:hypothetical protein